MYVIIIIEWLTYKEMITTVHKTSTIELELNILSVNY